MEKKNINKRDTEIYIELNINLILNNINLIK